MLLRHGSSQTQIGRPAPSIEGKLELTYRHPLQMDLWEVQNRKFKRTGPNQGPLTRGDYRRDRFGRPQMLADL